MKKTKLILFSLLTAFIIVFTTPLCRLPVSADTVLNYIASGSKLITSKNELKKIFISHITRLDKNFTLKINYTALQSNDRALTSFWKELTKYPEYNEIMEHAQIEATTVYNNQKYFNWAIKVKYRLSKKQAAKLLAKITPILRTEQELINAMVSHTLSLDKNFYINVDKRLLNLDSRSSYVKFWEKLYSIPEFNDVSRYYKNFDSTHNSYNGYSKWKIKTDYDITKNELDYLNNFVKSWVAKNINSSMTDEEKIRAINDFMVSKYRYTFGDKGQCPPNSTNCPEEKLGKYSVYSTFSLLYGGGGVCDAKAKLFYRLAKEAGFDVIYITGFVKKTILHAWNMVKVDGNWYHLDNTWNRSTEAGMSENEYINTRDYYLKSDATMREREHSWEKGKYPVAKTDYPLKEN